MEPKVNPEAAVVVGGAAFIPKVVVGAPKEKPPPAAVDFAGVPKLKPPVGLVVLWVWMDEPKVKPPPVAAGVDVVSPKPVVGAGAEAVVFCVPKVKPEEGCPKVKAPLIFSLKIKKITLLKSTNAQNGYFLAESFSFWRVTNTQTRGNLPKNRLLFYDGFLDVGV